MDLKVVMELLNHYSLSVKINIHNFERHSLQQKPKHNIITFNYDIIILNS